jgi:ribosomal protein L13
LVRAPVSHPRAAEQYTDYDGLEHRTLETDKIQAIEEERSPARIVEDALRDYLDKRKLGDKVAGVLGVKRK